MLSKQQFISTLLSGAIIFVILFGVCYAYFYKLGIEQPIIKEDAVEVVAQEGEPLVVKEEADIVRISPSTKVKVELMSEGKLQETQTLDPNTVMGMSEEDLEQQLSSYDVAVFTEEEVILQKNIEKVAPLPTYVLGAREGIVGIVEVTNTGRSTFVSLNMDLLEFSRVASEMITSEAIPITPTEKQKLQLNPYYIEAILQNHYE